MFAYRFEEKSKLNRMLPVVIIIFEVKIMQRLNIFENWLVRKAIAFAHERLQAKNSFQYPAANNNFALSRRLVHKVSIQFVPKQTVTQLVLNNPGLQQKFCTLQI
ncbi:hypothetical protein T4B_1999 [Trichinella pseudospiralis]|uniref:Uncharacterized protein n=1 Tax=Trichinella pseudospiralis TaxID=6337 RepID=A0A0V1EN30_TRIPS|nr:hypothetical protein T4A_12363 [Trichinella pseudospiralis]KRZ15851.1 hypothetical protein T4B_1999 [Trichinella pseudospiralis]